MKAFSKRRSVSYNKHSFQFFTDSYHEFHGYLLDAHSQSTLALAIDPTCPLLNFPRGILNKIASASQLQHFVKSTEWNRGAKELSTWKFSPTPVVIRSLQLVLFLLREEV